MMVMMKDAAVMITLQIVQRSVSMMKMMMFFVRARV